MATKFQAPRGTYDLLPDSAAERDSTVATAKEIFEQRGYRRIDTPAFEETGLFSHGVGEATDIVRKEMYTFLDKGDRSLTLRPEGTAPICRAYLEHGLHKVTQPVKLWYTGPMFRYETPQSGRFRQHYQIGVEAIGSAAPALDAELIVMQATLYAELGIESTLSVSSMGDTCCRPAYIEKLRTYLLQNRDALSEEQMTRIETNPVRAFDWQGIEAVLQAAPKLIDELCLECSRHLKAVCAYLDAAAVSYQLDGTLVRGLDYYSRTVFEFSSDQLGAQSGIGGGGRYDHLIETLGGQPTAAAGWASGLERVDLVKQAEPDREVRYDLFVAVATPDELDARVAAFKLVEDLNRQRTASGRRLSALLDLTDRSLKAQLKYADRIGARVKAVVGFENGQLRGHFEEMAGSAKSERVSGDERLRSLAVEFLAQVGNRN